MTHKEYLHLIFRINASTQMLFAIVEEFEFKMYMGPINEQRNAHTHLLRALAAIEGFKGDAEEPYIVDNLKSAVNHEYRAFYDVADWFTLKMREEIINTLKPYSDQAIQMALPKYFSEYSPKIEGLSTEIARLRLKKDVGNGDLSVHLEPYEKIVRELWEIYKIITSRKAVLADVAIRQSRGAKQNAWRLWRGSIVIAILTFILTQCWNSWGSLYSAAETVWKSIAK
ncbi:MAG: hypothetical protein H6Q74_766 [Firmicutes bacterium]|nr:hypothetical protein [Bacillota bacterium]